MIDCEVDQTKLAWYLVVALPRENTERTVKEEECEKLVIGWQSTRIPMKAMDKRSRKERKEKGQGRGPSGSKGGEV